MTTPAPKAPAWKRNSAVIAQGVVALATLAWIFHNKDQQRQVAAAMRHARVSWLVAGVACYGVVEMLGAMRWQLLLRMQGFRLSWRRAAAIFLIGLFLMTFTPGLIGGDAARVLYVMREAPERKADAVLAVAMDRLTGLVSLILLAAVVVLTRYRWLAGTPATGWLESVTLVILAGTVGSLVLSVLVARLPWLGMLKRYPGVDRSLREMGDTLRAYRRHWGRLLWALGNTLVAHLFYFITFYCAARALGAFDGAEAARGFRDIFSVMPIVNTLTALPISFAGIGIRESLFQVLLSDLCRIPPGIGAAIGSLGFAMRAVWGIPGGILLLRYRASGRGRLRSLS